MSIKYFGTNTSGEIKNKCIECRNKPVYVYVETRFGEFHTTNIIKKILQFFGNRYINNTIKFYCSKHYPLRNIK